jgi:DNA uptake protein ComE-like DNA-binding protein
MWRSKLSFVLISFSAGAYAQSEDELIRQAMERFTENADQQVDYFDLQEQLHQLKEHKINLNKADDQELKKLFFLRNEQTLAITNHLKKFGPLLSVYELQVIDALDPETIKLLIPFISLREEIQLPFRLTDLIHDGEQEFTNLVERDYPEGKGYKTAKNATNSYSQRYNGTPYRFVTRYRYRYKNRINLGLNAENDAGEPFFAYNNKKGFDFYSGHFFYQGNGLVKTVAIGDFQASFGQYLTMGTGLVFGKSAATLSTKRFNTGLRPYRSVNENSFLRGAAIALSKGRWEITPFYSRQRSDAGIVAPDSSETEMAETVSSFYSSGYHRTFAENDKRKTFVFNTAGMHLQYRQRGLRLGITGIRMWSDKPLDPKTDPYNLFYEMGRTFSRIGFNHDYSVRNVNFYGEVTVSHSSGNRSLGFATINGLIASFGKQFDLNLFYRNYSRDFITFQTNAIGENATNRNEKGFYWGAIFKPSKKVNFSAYLDLFRFDWLRYKAESPSSGNEYLAEISYQPNKKTFLYCRLRSETKAKNIYGYTENRQGVFSKRNLRFHADYQASDLVSMKTRMEVCDYTSQTGGTTQKGTLFFQDVNVKIPDISSTVSGRIVLFNVEDYDCRIYAFENDVLYSFSVPAFQNNGVRIYAMLHQRINRNLDFWIRGAITYYSNVERLGSGNDLIESNKKSNVSFQVRWVF